MAKNKIDINPNIILYGAIAVGGYFFVAKPLLELFGLKKSDEGKAIDNAADDKAFDPLFWQKAATSGISV